MPVFEKVPNNPDFPQIEIDLIKFWKKEKIFEKSVNFRDESKQYVFLEGPPTANGTPHPGHILTRVVKDSICRFKTMQGFRVERKAGWDTHGLPVEIEVEKELGLNSKREIEAYGIAKFNKKCKESVFRYEKAWREITERIGFWIDLDDPYITLKQDYIESVWWSLRQIWDKKLLYRGFRVTAYCPRCETPLSSHEVAQGYKQVKDPSVYVKFRIRNKPNHFLLAWTTTPWTLISNVALAVGSKIQYVQVEWEGEHLILARALVKNVFGEELPVEASWVGKKLLNWEYDQLYPQIKTDKKAFFVTNANFVSTEEGTGIVHIAPAFGEDDMKLGREYHLPTLQPVDSRGRFTEQIGFLAGKFVKDADPLIITDLTRRKLIYKVETYEHDYPYCWRCDTPLLYYARNAWFIEMTKLRDQLLKNNESVNWVPKHIKHGRFGNFLDSVVDWSLSRERYWGTPLPIWICTKCGHQHLIGGVEELKKMAKKIPKELDLHRPIIDNISLNCPKCNEEMNRVPEVLDTWYDSGSAPFAQWHYPFEKKTWFNKRFPVHFISEAIDQTRGWFYSLLAISTAVFNKSPYRNVLTLGHIQDSDGQKMSKSKGNVIDPWEFLNSMGADTFRWYFLSRHAPVDSFRFIKDNVTEVFRRFTNTLWNSFAFFITYANIDEINPKEPPVPYNKRSLIDQWLISKLNSVIQTVTEELEDFNLHKAVRSIEDFVVNDMSNWYIRLNRRIFWKPEKDQEKKSAYDTLWETLTTIARLVAPFTPFLADYLYKTLEKPFITEAPLSVHLINYPLANLDTIDENLNKTMQLVLEIVQAGRAARAKAQIRSRQPLTKVILVGNSAQTQLDSFKALICNELNVKHIEYTDDKGQFLSANLKPNFASLGKKYRYITKGLISEILKLDPSKVVDSLEADKKIQIVYNDKKYEILPEDIDISIKDQKGFTSAATTTMTVVLPTSIPDDLYLEGIMRDLVRRVQNFRKDLNLPYTKQIKLGITGNNDIKKVIHLFKDYIKEETLAVDLSLKISGTGQQIIWDFNNSSVTIEINFD